MVGLPSVSDFRCAAPINLFLNPRSTTTKSTVMFMTPTATVAPLAALMGATAAPIYAQDPSQSSHALLAARNVVDSIDGRDLSLRELYSPPTDKTSRLKRFQEVIEIPPATSDNADGVEVVDFKAMLQQELANLKAYVASLEFDENEAAAYQEGAVEWFYDKTLDKFADCTRSVRLAGTNSFVVRLCDS